MSDPQPVTLTVADASTAEWEIRHIDELDGDIAVKPLFSDPETGMSAMILKYFAGFTNEWHTHNCGHGLYVLEGVLRTHDGDYGPGSFVWFPEGGSMEHGATPDADVTVLFLTNKPLDIHYLHAGRDR